MGYPRTTGLTLKGDQDNSVPDFGSPGPPPLLYLPREIPKTLQVLRRVGLTPNNDSVTPSFL